MSDSNNSSIAEMSVDDLLGGDPLEGGGENRSVTAVEDDDDEQSQEVSREIAIEQDDDDDNDVDNSSRQGNINDNKNNCQNRTISNISEDAALPVVHEDEGPPPPPPPPPPLSDDVKTKMVIIEDTAGVVEANEQQQQQQQQQSSKSPGRRVNSKSKKSRKRHNKDRSYKSDNKGRADKENGFSDRNSSHNNTNHTNTTTTYNTTATTTVTSTMPANSKNNAKNNNGNNRSSKSDDSTSSSNYDGFEDGDVMEAIQEQERALAAVGAPDQASTSSRSTGRKPTQQHKHQQHKQQQQQEQQEEQQAETEEAVDTTVCQDNKTPVRWMPPGMGNAKSSSNEDGDNNGDGEEQQQQEPIAKTTSKEALYALHFAASAAQQFEKYFASMKNAQLENMTPLFTSSEVVASEEPLRFMGYFTEYSLKAIRIKHDDEKDNTSSDEEQHQRKLRRRFMERSIDGYYCVKYVQAGLIEATDHGGTAAADMIYETRILMNLRPQHPNVTPIYAVNGGGIDSFLEISSSVSPKVGFFFISDRIVSMLPERIEQWRKKKDKESGNNSATSRQTRQARLEERMSIAFDISSAMVFFTQSQHCLPHST